MGRDELEEDKKSAEFHVSINMTLIMVVFAILPFIAAVNPELLQKDYFLTTQLILTIPLLMSSSFARAKFGVRGKLRSLNRLGFVSFILGYGFLINSLGILLSFFTPVIFSVLFFSANIIMAITYSIVMVSSGSTRLKNRIIKDSFFIAILLVLGIFHVIGWY